MSSLMDRLTASLDPQPLLDGVVLWLPNLLAATLTLFMFWLVARVLSRGLAYVSKRAQFDVTASSFVDAVMRYALFTLGAVTVLSQLGVDVTGLVTGLGVAGLTVGFAARDALSNIISGLFIFWDRPFVIGDLVDVDGRYGRVEAITLRSTRVVTPDGRMLAFPNATIINSVVASYTNFPNLRLDVDVTVGVDSDVGACRRILLDLVIDQPGFMAEPAPVVWVTELGDYFIRLELRVWLTDERGHINTRMMLRERILEAFRAGGIDMPCETIQLQPILVKGARLSG